MKFAAMSPVAMVKAWQSQRETVLYYLKSTPCVLLVKRTGTNHDTYTIRAAVGEKVHFGTK